MDKLLTQREAAQMLRVSVEKLRRMRYEGELEFVNLGYRSVRIRQSEIESLIRRKAA